MLRFLRFLFVAWYYTSSYDTIFCVSQEMSGLSSVIYSRHTSLSTKLETVCASSRLRWTYRCPPLLRYLHPKGKIIPLRRKSRRSRGILCLSRISWLPSDGGRKETGVEGEREKEKDYIALLSSICIRYDSCPLVISVWFCFVAVMRWSKVS